MTNEEFEEMYSKSLDLLNAYIKTQQKSNQVVSATHRKNHVVMNKRYYQHIANKNEHLHLCKVCGAIEAACYSEPAKSLILENETCFQCEFWAARAIEKNPNMIVINGEVYSDGGNNKGDKRFLGFGGHVWKIERDGVVFETNNLWHGGVVPQEFRHILTDNARFV